MRTYDELRQRKQLVSEAMAFILAKETARQKKLFANFLCCRIHKLKPVDFSQDASSSSEGEETEKDSETGVLAKLMFNVNQIRNEVRGLKYKTREKFEG